MLPVSAAAEAQRSSSGPSSVPDQPVLAAMQQVCPGCARLRSFLSSIRRLSRRHLQACMGSTFQCPCLSLSSFHDQRAHAGMHQLIPCSRPAMLLPCNTTSACHQCITCTLCTFGEAHPLQSLLPHACPRIIGSAPFTPMLIVYTTACLTPVAQRQAMGVLQDALC